LNNDDLISRARAVLRLNDTGEFTKPSPRQYPHQWNWDSAFIALGLAHFDLPRASPKCVRFCGRSGVMEWFRTSSTPRRSDYFPPPEF
jgi:hypothetical protein